MAIDDSTKESVWKRLKAFFKKQTNLVVIIVAAVLLETALGIMFYLQRNLTSKFLNEITDSEMLVISLGVRNHFTKIEATLDNMAWMLTDRLDNPNSLFQESYKLLENNPNIYGCSIACIPNLFPDKGYWFEPYAVRKSNGSIESSQLGSANHDYTKSSFYVEAIARGEGHWSEPYLDSDGAKTMITSYSVPIRNKQNNIVAVISADISLDWVAEVMNNTLPLEHSKRFLISSQYTMLGGENNLLFNTIVQHLKTNDVSNGYFELNDENVHVFFDPIGGKTDWLIICAVDEDIFFGFLKKRQLFMLLLVGVCFLLLYYIVQRTSRNQKQYNKVHAEKERISSELQVAHEIQQGMLPSSSLKLKNVEVYGSLVPAREVGGDTFYYHIVDDYLYFCIGDVSGKSTPSALFMASISSLFIAFSKQKDNPAAIMRRINAISTPGNDTCLFITLFIGMLHLPTGRLLYCNAGHDSPLIKSDGFWSTLTSASQIPVGLVENMQYDEQEVYLAPSSEIFLYTDGVTEAVNSSRQLFGIDRLEQVLATCTDVDPQALQDAVTKAVHQFVGNAEQSDDLTMLVIHYKP
ncbi:MAG: SpoIIE family protein phosphatase [Bacteroidaceae bacterium]|nr:SpoIIE family protein phosphatase [Bacteroidaceae bacterium]